jgi:hypothetical protein
MKEKLIRFLDKAAPEIIAIALLFQPYFRHGIIDFWETGLYLPFIEGLFNGKIIFKDMVLHRGPLEIYIPYLFMLLFGKHISVLSAFYYFGNILNIVLCLRIARYFLKTRIFLYLLIPVLAAKTFPITFYQNWGGIRFGCGLAAVLCALNYLKNKKPALLFISGLFSGIGFFSSTEIGILSSLAVIVTLIVYGRSAPQTPKAILHYAAGFCLICIPFIAHLLFSGGLLTYIQANLSVPFCSGDIYHFEILYPGCPRNLAGILKYALRPFDLNFRFALPLFLYVSVAAFLLINYSRKHDSSQTQASFLCLSLYGFLMYMGSLRQINGPQFQTALQPALILFFIALERYFLFFKKMQSQGSIRFSTKANGSIIFLILFSLLFSAVFTVKFYINYGRDLRRFAFHLITKGCFPAGEKIKPLAAKTAKGVLVADTQAEEINSVVEYIQKNTVPREAVFTFPNQGTFNFLFERPEFSRFYFSDMAFYRPDWKNEFFSQLKNKKPRYAVIKREPDWFEAALADYPIIKGREEVRNFIRRNYNLEASFGRIDIYKAK